MVGGYEAAFEQVSDINFVVVERENGVNAEHAEAERRHAENSSEREDNRRPFQIAAHERDEQPEEKCRQRKAGRTFFQQGGLAVPQSYHGRKLSEVDVVVDVAAEVDVVD